MGRKLSVLVVEMDHSLRSALGDFFWIMNFRKVVQFGGNVIDLKRILESSFDLITFCVVGAGGKPAVKNLVAIIKENHPETKVMLISGIDVVDLAEVCRQSGADAFLSKPFLLKDLEGAVWNLFPESLRDNSSF